MAHDRERFARRKLCAQYPGGVRIDGKVLRRAVRFTPNPPDGLLCEAMTTGTALRHTRIGYSVLF